MVSCYSQPNHIFHTWYGQTPAGTALEGRGRSYHAEAAHGLRTWYATHYVQLLGARGNPSGQEYCSTTENTPPRPTTPPLAKVPGPVLLSHQ